MTERPLIIWAHGGSFVAGSKTGTDVVPLAEDFAKMGYVTASISYRLGMENTPLPGPDSVDATETVIRAVHDGRAAVRFFRKDYVENGNTYKAQMFWGDVEEEGKQIVEILIFYHKIDNFLVRNSLKIYRNMIFFKMATTGCRATIEIQ